MEKTKHIGSNLRNIRILRGMKQETFAREYGIAQQNVSKMEKKKVLTDEQVNQAAKILQTTAEAIKNFDENGMIQNNLFNDQVNNFNPIEKVVELYERMLKEAKDENQILRTELEGYRNGKNKSSKPKESAESQLHTIPSQQTKKAAK
jgi:transcriptional regulator with XRE-family HTH domain